MKRRISLKWFVVLSFLAMAVALVIGYSLLSMQFFVRGMDNIVAGNMAQVVESYVASIPAPQRQRLNHFSGYRIGSNWLQMPEKIRRAFKEPEESGVLFKQDDSGWFAPPDEVHFMMRVVVEGHAYFISQSVTRKTASPMGGRNAAQNIQILAVLSLGTILILAVIIWLVLRQVERPVKTLGLWARSLNENNLNETPPDFSYPELNELANLIRSSLASVQKSLEREHRFLRHSSHELRTPISVIRNNIELLRKVEESAEKKWDARQKQIIERIDRASLNMKHMTETLLWLSRESDENLPVKKLDIEKLIRNLIAQVKYLLKEKEVDLVVETVSYVVEVAEIPARIVLGNLIRNAFQHTWTGAIHIVQQDANVEIVNDMVKGNETTEELGFGLGLQLTEQLTQKLNWSYTSRSENGRHRTTVHIG